MESSERTTKVRLSHLLVDAIDTFRGQFRAACGDEMPTVQRLAENEEALARYICQVGLRTRGRSTTRSTRVPLSQIGLVTRLAEQLERAVTEQGILGLASSHVDVYTEDDLAELAKPSTRFGNDVTDSLLLQRDEWRKVDALRSDLRRLGAAAIELQPNARMGQRILDLASALELGICEFPVTFLFCSRTSC